MKEDCRKRPIVWIVNQSYQHDFSAAKKFGDLQELTKGIVDPFNTDELLKLLLPTLEQVQKDDFLLICGHTVLNMVVGDWLLNKYGKVRMLVYGAKFKDYRIVAYTRPGG